MRSIFLLVLLLVTSSCDTVVRLSAQLPRFSPPTPQFRKVGLYIRNSEVPSRLHASVDGELLYAGGVAILLDDAVYGSVRNALGAVSEEVIMLDTLPTLTTMKRLDLDAAFWIEHFRATSQLQRQGTLYPSYTTYSNVALKLKRMSGFRGTIDSLDITGFGSFSRFGAGTARSSIARVGAEIALQDVATRLAKKLTVSQFK